MKDGPPAAATSSCLWCSTYSMRPVHPRDHLVHHLPYTIITAKTNSKVLLVLEYMVMSMCCWKDIVSKRPIRPAYSWASASQGGKMHYEDKLKSSLKNCSIKHAIPEESVAFICCEMLKVVAALLWRSVDAWRSKECPETAGITQKTHGHGWFFSNAHTTHALSATDSVFQDWTI